MEQTQKLKFGIIVLAIIMISAFASGLSVRTVYNPFTHLQDYVRTGNFTGENIFADNITANTITLNGTSIDDWNDISTIINTTELWTNESGVATYYGNVEAKGNITIDEKINMAQSAQIFIDETGCINFVAGNGK